MTCWLAALGLVCGGPSVPQAKPAPQTLTEAWQDPLFVEPFIDVDEWRDHPVRHRYVHGGFKGTDLLFSIYLPPKEQYRGRFFQPVYAMPGSENAAQRLPGQKDIFGHVDLIGFAAASGAYLLESNQGKKDKYPTADRTITGYRASAAAAKFSRRVAQQMYGPHRPFGYAFGGSGGAFKVISFAQNTKDIWDGIVPFVIGSPMAAPSAMTVQAHALRVLGDSIEQVVDNIDPGSGRDMYAGLTADQQAALREATRTGFPPRAWFAHERLGYGPLGGLIEDMVARDPDYFASDFWTEPGYLGSDPASGIAQARIRQHRAKITAIVMSDEAARRGLRVTSAAIGKNVVPAAFVIDPMPSGEIKGATIAFRSGGARERAISASGRAGELVTIDISPSAFSAIGSVAVGDEVEIDNSSYLAAQTLHRHVVPTPDYYTWDQFRGPDGKPLYPQRSFIQGPWVPERAAGDVPNGRVHSKVIAVETMDDELAFPWNADWYASKVRAHLGPKFEDNFRLWFFDHAMHTAPTSNPDRARMLSYASMLEQALRDLSAWVEKGIPPPTSTAYSVIDGQVRLPARAAERKGIQPVVTLAVRGAERAEVRVGEVVEFRGTIQVPPGTGKIVRAEWDFEGGGTYPVLARLGAGASAGEQRDLTASYAFPRPGTYFPVLRAASQRQPDGTPYAQVENLARVRVVVR